MLWPRLAEWGAESAASCATREDVDSSEYQDYLSDDDYPLYSYIDEEELKRILRNYLYLLYHTSNDVVFRLKYKQASCTKHCLLLKHVRHFYRNLVSDKIKYN